ncbi:sarcosine oxidase subunit delta [Arhodomonas sp. AD133]|uniref:sarcosine oxidase subunit delta n=1 Tax=Arhodomonas sp. AD133 TaxID=3415009 RepID=UPI003EBCF9BC
MLYLACPHCGERPCTEFTYGGDATVRRPADALKADDEAWTAYLYQRRNPGSEHTEYWEHTRGCRRWLVVRRDTVNQRVFSVRDVDRAASEVP